MSADRRMTTRRRTRLVALLGLLMLPGCGIIDFGDDDEVEAEGVVEFVDVEGGCWSIRTSDTVYEPVDLPEEFRQDGLAVEFEGRLRTDLASICQVGELIEIEEIELDDD